MREMLLNFKIQDSAINRIRIKFHGKCFIPILFPDEVDQGVVYVGSSRLEEAGARRQLMEEEQLLFLRRNNNNVKSL
jgi:hypothetical protein